MHKAYLKQSNVMRSFLLTSLLYLCIPTEAMAEVYPVTSNQQEQKSISFGDLDRNHDGFVDATEASAEPSVSAAFKQADKNHDGKLNQEEFNDAIANLK